jgi:hypothetical protein
MSGPKLGYEIGNAKAWATAHIIAAVAIALVIGFIIRSVL